MKLKQEFEYGTVKPVLRGDLLGQGNRPYKTDRGSIHMKFSISGQEKRDLLIQVSA